MEQIQLTSHVRTGTGKGFARQLRREGLMPAVLYGGKLGNIPLSVDAHDFRLLVAKSGWESLLLNLVIEGDGGKKKTNVIIKDFQLDPVKQTVLHADFLEITMGEAIEVNIPLELAGESPGAKEGGTIEFVTREVMVECLPSKMVDHIDVDISSLEIGDTLTVEDISTGDDLTILTEPDVVVATVTAPRPEEEEEEEMEIGEAEMAEPEVIRKGKKLEEEEE